jgi:hypothetical protein
LCAAEQLPGERDGLCVIARRIGDDAAALLVVRELGEGVVRAAELERAHALEVLALEEHLRAGERVHRARGERRRPVRAFADALVRAREVVEAHIHDFHVHR